MRTAVLTVVAMAIAVQANVDTQRRASIVGTWRLRSASASTVDGRLIEAPFGSSPAGVITYTPEGRMMAIISYSNSVKRLLGVDQILNAYRLFMVPGMAHCWDGDGATAFDPLDALETWVEKGTAPDRIVASRWVDGKIDRTHPLCGYPQVAEYKGTGSIDVAENFICKER